LLNETRDLFFSIFLIRLFRKTRYLLYEYKVKINIDEVRKNETNEILNSSINSYSLSQLR
jgi:hypothetical protein